MSHGNELLPCPFCGGESEMGVNKESTVREYFVGCMNCHIRLYKIGYKRFYTEAEAIAAWNTRTEHGSGRTTELLRELRDLACDIHAAEIIDHVHITNRGWTFDSQWLDSWHNEFDRITNELNTRAERTCECVAEYAKSPIDGKTIVLHRCSACHELMRPHMSYCPSCGAKVVGE